MNGAVGGTVHGSATTGVAPAPLEARRLRMYRGSFWLFILAESFGFVALFAIRFLLAGTGHPGELRGMLGAATTLAFMGSAVPAVWALRAIAAGDRDGMVRRLQIALGLGLAALWFVVADLSSSTIAPASRFGGIYIATVGYHAIHIVVGLLFLTALQTSGRRGRFDAGNHWLVEAGIRFWLFVVVAWLALYVVFYWL